MPDVANLVVRYTADTKDAEAGADRVNSSIGKVTKAGAALAIAGGALVGGFFAKSVLGAANFEQSMDGVAASLGGVDVAGGITTAQFTKLQDEALRIGQTTQVGATDAARAMDLLAKSGIPVEEIYNGVAQGVVDVSTATGENLDQSAATYGALQNLFRDTGITSDQMSDTIVNAMNASNMSLSEFQTGIARMGPVIAATGMPLDQAAGALAYFNSQGFSAAEVGTSLTAAFNNLVAPTEAQAAAQQAMGISAFDAQGQFVGWPAIMDQVQAATVGMTDAQRAETIATLFGADARDLMTLATKKGGDPLRDYTKLMDKSGTAATAAATRMDNLRGDVEGLKGAFETLSIRVGTAFLPALRGIVQGMTAGVTAVTGFAQSVIKLMDNGLNPIAAVFAALQKVLFDLSGGNGVLGTLADALSQLTILAINLGEAFADVVDAFQDLRRGDFAGAWREIQEAAQTAFDAISQFAGITLDWVLDTGVPAVIGWVADYATDVWNGIKSAAGWVWDNRAELGNITLAGAVSLGNELMGSLSAAIDTLVSTATRLFQSHKASLQTALETLFDFDIGANFGNNLGARFGAWLSGLDWGNLFGQGLNLQTKLMQGIGAAALGAITLLGGFTGQMASAIGGFLTGMVGAIKWGGIGDALRSKFEEASTAAFGQLDAWSASMAGLISGALASGIEGLQGFAGNIKTKLLAEMDQAKPSSGDLSGFGSDIASSLSSAITSGVSDMVGFAAGIKSTIISELQQAVPSAGDLAGVGSALASALWDAIKSAAASWDWKSLIPDSLPFGRQVRDFGPDAAAAQQATSGKNDFSSLTSGTSTALAAVRAMATQAAAAMAQFANAIRTGASQASAALVPVGTAFRTLGTTAQTVTAQMGASVRAQFTTMGAAVQASTTQMAAQVNAQFAQMAAQGTAQANSLRAGVSSAIQGMASAGASAMSQFSGAVRSGFSQAVSAAQSGVAGIRGAVNSIGSLYGQGFSIGASFGQGVAAGLYSMLGAVQAAAAAIVAAAAQAAAAAGRISSPSKLMRDEIGVPLAQGIAVGMESQRRNVADTFASLLPVDARAGRHGFGLSASVSRTAGGSTTIVHNHYNIVKSDEMVKIIKGSERGDKAYRQMQPRSRDLQLGTSRSL